MPVAWCRIPCGPRRRSRVDFRLTVMKCHEDSCLKRCAPGFWEEPFFRWVRPVAQSHDFTSQACGLGASGAAQLRHLHEPGLGLQKELFHPFLFQEQCRAT